MCGVMDDLVAFISAALDEDQRLAEAARVVPDRNQPNIVLDQWWTVPDLMARGHGWAEAHFVVAWDPARVLAEVRAKRRTLERHCRVNFTDVAHGIVDEPVCALCHVVLDEPEDWRGAVDWDFPWVQVPYPCATILDLAQSLSGRPGWRQEWATEVTA
jgi:hypothetical protein